jgi:hypothetical protein
MFQIDPALALCISIAWVFLIDIWFPHLSILPEGGSSILAHDLRVERQAIRPSIASLLENSYSATRPTD